MVSQSSGAGHETAHGSFFEKRQLRRYAGIWSLWALGVGAVISGHFSGWNYGLAVAGWGGLLAAAAIMAFMFLCLVFCIAEMSAALPDAGATYVFARRAMGPWGGFLSGVCDNVEYVLTPAVICFFIGSYLGSMFDTGLPDWCWWIATYGLFLVLNIRGIALSFRVTLVITLISLAILLLFCALAVPHIDIARWALNVGVDGTELAGGSGPLFPFGLQGVLAALPFAVWLYLAIEELPLAAEESVDPRRDMPRGILLALATLTVTAFLIAAINPAVNGVGAYKLGTSGEPILDGLRALYGNAGAIPLGLIALSGLIASFHAIIFGLGRQIFALSRSGYFPAALSRTHTVHKTPPRRATHRLRARPRHHDDVVVRARRQRGRAGDRQRPSQHGGVRRYAVIHPARDLVHRPAPAAPGDGKALLKSIRPIRRSRRHRDLSGHAVLSVAGPEFFQGRSLGHPVVR